MSRDATGFESGRAKQSIHCPTCAAPIGEACTLSEAEYGVEHGVHLQRVEAYQETRAVILKHEADKEEMNREQRREFRVEYTELLDQHLRLWCSENPKGGLANGKLVRDAVNMIDMIKSEQDSESRFFNIIFTRIQKALGLSGFSYLPDVAAKVEELVESLAASRREIDRIAEGERLESDGLHSLETENAKLRADNVDLKKEVDDYQHQLNGLNGEGLTMDKERKALEDKLAAIKAIVAEPPTTKVCGARGGGSHQYEWRCERREHHTGECDPDEKLAKAADHHDKHGRTHNENASKYERICRILGA